MTVRRLMAAVAIVAIVLAVGVVLKKRRDERLERQAFFASFELKFMARVQEDASGERRNMNQERLNYFRAMRQKWAWAASHPWESVEPDPP